MEYARRLFYIGPVHHKICFVDEPPLPESYYPHNYPMQVLKLFYNRLSPERWKNVIDYYMKIEEKGV